MSPNSFSFWDKFWLALFGLSVPVMIYLAWRIASMGRRIEERKKQIQKDLHSPGMEEVRFLLKPSLKEHDIQVDDSLEKNG